VEELVAAIVRSTLKMEAAGSSELFLPMYQAARRHVPEARPQEFVCTRHCMGFYFGASLLSVVLQMVCGFSVAS